MVVTSRYTIKTPLNEVGRNSTDRRTNRYM